MMNSYRISWGEIIFEWEYIKHTFFPDPWLWKYHAFIWVDTGPFFAKDGYKFSYSWLTAPKKKKRLHKSWTTYACIPRHWYRHEALPCCVPWKAQGKRFCQKAVHTAAEQSVYAPCDVLSPRCDWPINSWQHHFSQRLKGGIGEEGLIASIAIHVCADYSCQYLTKFKKWNKVTKDSIKEA